MKKLLQYAAAFLLLSTFSSQLSTAHAQGTAFTYQGRLNDGANPANGVYDFRFALHDAASAGVQQGNLLTNAATLVSNGLFTVTLDFGNQFPGANRWLEIGVRTNDAGVFTNLAPRQQLAATPYAMTASNLTGSLPAAQLSGAIANANLPASPTFSGTATAGSFSGSGAGVTALNAGNISSGTLNDARLSANVALLNAGQTFTGVNTFNNPANSFAGNGAGLTNINLMTVLPGVIFTLSTNISTFGFSIASAPLVGDNPHSVVTADVNGDAKPDLISANYGGGSGNTLSVLTNNGTGAFVLAATPSVGNAPVFVTAADVNADGKVDVISANYNGAGTLSVLTNNGSGGFVLAATLTVGNSPDSIAATDVNGDGKVDLVSANFSGNTLSVLTNNGSGGFALASLPAVTGNPNSVVAADVNGDTTMDLITANFNGNNVSVLLGAGNGNFVLVASPAVGAAPFAVTTADVNGDGKVDLISANSSGNTLSVLTNNGAGTFGSNATLTVGSGPRSVVAADVNRDGKVDLIAGGLSATLSVFTNNGAGGFGLAVSPNSGAVAWSLAAADLNGDTNLDLVTATGGSTVIVLFNTLSGVTVSTSATFQGNFTGSTLTVDGNLTAGNFTGNGAGLTNVTATTFTGSLSGDVTGTQGATVVSSVGGQGAANVASGASAANAATSANTASTIVKRDGSGNFSAGTITAALSGNATTATTATSATSATTAITAGSFSGSLSGDVSGTQGATVVGAVGGQTAANVASGASAANAATSANTASTIVKRDASGSFNAGGITGTNFTGNGGSLTNLKAANLVGTIADARLSTNVTLLDTAQIFSADKGFTNGAQLRLDDGTNTAPALTFNNENTGIYEPAPNSIAFVNSGTEHIRINSVGRLGIGTNAPSAPLDVIGAAKFSGNVTVGAFPIVAVSTVVPTAGSTLTPTTGYVKLDPASVISLSFTTAITSGTTPGQLLILQGITSGGSLAITNGANTVLGSNRRFVDNGDTLTLIWDGSNWVEISYVNN